LANGLRHRALQRATTPDGLFTILAIDHQDALRRALNPKAPDSVSDHDVVFFKQQVVSSLIDSVSGVLLDPIYGAFQAIADGTLASKGCWSNWRKPIIRCSPCRWMWKSTRTGMSPRSSR
jgi:tagatose-1,6-bisphosphate aldolase